MKPKRKLKSWVKIFLLLLPEVVVITLLFLIVVNLKENSREVNINIQCSDTPRVWSEKNE